MVVVRLTRQPKSAPVANPSRKVWLIIGGIAVAAVVGVAIWTGTGHALPAVATNGRCTSCRGSVYSSPPYGAYAFQSNSHNAILGV